MMVNKRVSVFESEANIKKEAKKNKKQEKTKKMLGLKIYCNFLSLRSRIIFLYDKTIKLTLRVR